MSEIQTTNTELLNLETQLASVGLERFVVDRESEAGYVFTDELLHDKTDDEVLFDLDDTIVGYTAAKRQRQLEFSRYAQEQGVDLEEEQLELAMKITDQFSRWANSNEGEESYHQPAHANALAWVIDEVKNGKDFESVISAVTQFDAAKQPKSVPFDLDVMVERITPVFRKMIELDAYPDVLQAMVKLANPNNPEARVSIGILTYGEPEFQLEKLIHVMKTAKAQGITLPISQIMLTRIQKGDFLADITVAERQPKAYVLVDDSPTQLDSRSRAKAAFSRVQPVRIIKPKTKSESEKWVVYSRISDSYIPTRNQGGTGQYDGEDSEQLAGEILRVVMNTRAKLTADMPADQLSGVTREKANRKTLAYKAELLDTGRAAGFMMTLLDEK